MLGFERFAQMNLENRIEQLFQVPAPTITLKPFQGLNSRTDIPLKPLNLWKICPGLIRFGLKS